MEDFFKDPEKMRTMFAQCPINYTMNKIGGKWKPIILHRIKVGVNRFGILQRAIPIISKQMLTSQLRELEEDGFIERKIYAEIPPRVEYSISPLGVTVFPVLDAIAKWGKDQMDPVPGPF
jgi:DNA-binding HxlR family transcriptional regulator